MADINLPVPGSDFNTWGEKLNNAVTVVNDQGEPANVRNIVSTDIETTGSDIEGALRAKIAKRSVETAVIEPNAWSGDRASAKLQIPTYEGSGQTVHPDVFYDPAGWGEDSNGKAWKWWMAHTPYPGSNGAFENPSIVVSDDGETWVTPPGLSNPIAGPVDGAYLSDPELNLGLDGLLYLTYRTVFGSTERISYRTSTSGVAWSAETDMFSVTASDNQGCVSPTLAYGWGKNAWNMWSGILVSGAYVLEMRTSPSIGGPWSAPVACDTPLPSAPVAGVHQLWHFDVINYGGQFVMLAATKSVQYFQYLGTSEDGLNWTFDNSPAIPRGGSGRWDEEPYRGCLVPVTTVAGPVLRAYYSASSQASGWGIGLTEIRPKVALLSRSGAFLPGDHNNLAWTMDPTIATGISNGLNPGAVTYALMKVAVGGFVGEINAQVVTAGTGLTAGQNKFAIYDVAGNLLGETADITSNLTATGGKGFPLIAPTRLLKAGELLMVGYLFNGSGAPRFAGMANPAAYAIGRTTTVGPFYPPRGGRFGSSLTTPPATVETAIIGEAWVPWMGLRPATTV